MAPSLTAGAGQVSLGPNRTGSGRLASQPEVSMTDSLAELHERRDYECRLTPDRALESLADAHDFLRERGLLTRTADCALPSLYEACHEDPYQAGGRGFASWPATKWPWAHELSELPDEHVLDIHRGKNILLSDELLALVDPVCRAELARMEHAERPCEPPC
jgi:hypothetical protein